MFEIKNDMFGLKNDMIGVKNDMSWVKNDMFGSCCDLFAQVGGAGRGGISPPLLPPLWVPRGRDLGGGKTPHWKDYTRKQSWNSFPGKISEKIYEKKSILEFILWKK